VTTNELIRRIFKRVGKFKFLILALGILCGAGLYMYAKNIPAVFTSRATVFPLTASSDNSMQSNALSSILGISEQPKSFSSEASINIVELAQSRNTREAVVMEKLPELGNRLIAHLLIDNYNKTKSIFSSSIPTPTDQATLAAVGGDILKSGISAKITKNGILELTFSSTNPLLISPISYVLIDKISQFYKDLKVSKAKLDYDFTVRKIDSLQYVLNLYDKRAVRMSNTTLFVQPGKVEYDIPKENLISDKERVMRQRDASANNREEALWRLQKVTPIIAILDKPDPPFAVKKTSSLMYGGVGFITGCIFAIFLTVSGLLYRYSKSEINKAVFGNEVISDTTTTTLAS